MWGKDGLYLVYGDLSDSIRVSTKEMTPVKLPPAVSTDKKLFMVHSKICDFENSECISIDSFLPRPIGVLGYGFLYYSFNPLDSEVLFELGCEKNRNLEDGKPYDERESYEEFSIATFNYVDNKLTVLDSLIDLNSCRSPTYSPDGLKIAFMSGRNVYVMYRGVKP